MKLICALAVSMLALAACGGGGKHAAIRSAATGTTAASTVASATTSVPNTSSSTPAPGGKTTPGVRPGAAPANASGQSSGSSAASGPKPATPVSPGHYVYDTSGTSQVANGPPRPMPSHTSLAVDAPHGPQQHTVRDLRDQDGSGTVTDQVLEYDGDGVHLVSLQLQTTFAGISRTYRFVPSDKPMVVQTGAGPGYKTSFTLQGDGVTVATAVQVTGVVQVATGGGSVQALEVVLDSTLSGALQGTQHAVNDIATDRSLTVKEQVASDATSQGVRVQVHYSATVKSLQPS